MNNSRCFYLLIMIIYANKSILAKRVGKARAAPAWNPDSNEEGESTVLTRRFLKPKTLPPLPLPPIDPDEDLNDRSVLIAANEHTDEEDMFPTTETTNIRVLPFEGRRHQTILPIPPIEQVEEAASGEEEFNTGIIIPSSIEQSNQHSSEPPTENQPSDEIIVTDNSDEPPSVLVPASESVEFIPVEEIEKVQRPDRPERVERPDRPERVEKPVQRPIERPVQRPIERVEKVEQPVEQHPDSPPSIRPPSTRHSIVVERRPTPKLLPPSPIPRQSRILIPSAELESEELVPVVRPVEILPENSYQKPNPTVEKKAGYNIGEQLKLILPKKTRKMYKIYRPDVIEVDRGPFPPSSRSVYVAKRPPILVEEMEIPAELIESLQRQSTTTTTSKPYEKPPEIQKVLHRGSGQFLSRRLTYRRIHKHHETTTAQPSTTLPPPITRRYTTSTKRLLFTYRPRYITTTPKSYRPQEGPIEFVYKKSPTSSSYHKFIVRRKQLYQRPRTVHRKQAKTYPTHQKYSRTNYKSQLFPEGYQRQLTRQSFYGYA